jgi:hypothetical protein
MIDRNASVSEKTVPLSFQFGFAEQGFEPFSTSMSFCPLSLWPDFDTMSHGNTA